MLPDLLELLVLPRASLYAREVFVVRKIREFVGCGLRPVKCGGPAIFTGVSGPPFFWFLVGRVSMSLRRVFHGY
jgi:hypothetical protein